MKLLFKYILLLGIMAYLIFAMVKLFHHKNTDICDHVHITISDSAQASFMTKENAINILKKHKIYPEGKQMSDINTRIIDSVLNTNSFIKQVKSYKTADQGVQITIMQRLPLMRVLTEQGDNYYLDNTGVEMETLGYPANLIVATGNISSRFAQTTLVPLGEFIRKSDFWENLIEEIHVLPNHEIELIPRIGNHVILLGSTDSIPKKLRNLSLFYNKVLPEVGWNKYSEIDLRYPNQVIGRTPKEKKKNK